MSAKPSIKLYWPVGLPKSMPDRTSRGDLLDTTLSEYTRKVLGPGTEVVIGWMEKTTSALSSTYLGMVNDVWMINDILEAERAGFDACFIGPHWDCGLYAARTAARMPVIGSGEAAMMTAMQLGQSFAMLTVMDGYVPYITRNIHTYGLEGRAISRRPVRKFGMTYDNFVECLEGKSDQFLVEFEKTAKECIADGADVIIAGGQLFGPAFTRHNFWSIPNTGVPVVEVSACGMLMAEARVKLHRNTGIRKSEHIYAPFKTQGDDVLDKALKAFGIRD